MSWLSQHLYISWSKAFRWTGYNKMESTIFIKRKTFTDLSTIGELLFDNEPICFTLEDTVRKNGVKIFGKTAIPSGKYELVINYSNKFQKMLPLLINVPGFEGVRIHSGNRPEDTEGCILVGKDSGQDLVSDSRVAFNELFAKIQDAIQSRKVFVSIG